MSSELSTEDRGLKPTYHMGIELHRWHQYQGQDTNDCGAFSAAIVSNAILNNHRFDGYAVAREMEKLVIASQPLPHIMIRKIPNWATLPWGISGYLKDKGTPARLKWFGHTEDLLRNIRGDRPTIVLLGEPFLHVGWKFAGWAHAKVLYGFEPTGPRPERGFYFVDPGYPKNWSRPWHPPGVFWQDAAEFQQQWSNMLGLYVEAEASF
jgi:hypothetical protein